MDSEVRPLAPPPEQYREDGERGTRGVGGCSLVKTSQLAGQIWLPQPAHPRGLQEGLRRARREHGTLPTAQTGSPDSWPARSRSGEQSKSTPHVCDSDRANRDGRRGCAAQLRQPPVARRPLRDCLRRLAAVRPRDRMPMHGDGLDDPVALDPSRPYRLPASSASGGGARPVASAGRVTVSDDDPAVPDPSRPNLLLASVFSRRRRRTAESGRRRRLVASPMATQ